MQKSAIVNATGADFRLLGPENTMLKSTKPVIAVCAVRTGCGKSQISRKLFELLLSKGLRVASIRHPMPYDTDLVMQTNQRFAGYDDLDRYNTTIEEREEYEPYIDMGGVIYAGVDYEKILRDAEKEADVIIWDGGNNDFSFIQPDFLITIADPHRPGHETGYYPGEVNARSADMLIINKVNTAEKENIEQVRSNLVSINAKALIIDGISEVVVEKPDEVKGKKVLIIEDGPTVTHGGMAYGAGWIAAQKYAATDVVDPRSSAVGSIKATFDKFPHLEKILPAMGYGEKQVKDLETTINKVDCDLVISGTPIDISRVLQANKPIVRVRYGVGSETGKLLEKMVNKFIIDHKLG
jgi:predicted GTPase